MRILCDNRKDHSFEEWLICELRGKLKKASMVFRHSHKHVLLYRNTIEETGYASEEEVCFLVEGHIIVVLYAYGGFIPSKFQQVRIDTIDNFTKSIVRKRRKDLLLQCFENVGQYE